MANQKDIDAVIQMLDASMMAGTGHVNVVVNEKDITIEEVTVEKGMGCSLGDSACQIPNLKIEEEDV